MSRLSRFRLGQRNTQLAGAVTAKTQVAAALRSVSARSVNPRVALSQRTNPSEVALCQLLETRVLLTTTFFLDFGLGIGMGNTMSTTVGDFRNIFGNGLGGNGTGSRLDGRSGMTNASSLVFTPLAYDFDGNGLTNDADIVALADAVVPIVERALEPFDIDVVVASATSLTDAATIVAANNSDPNGSADAYNFVMEVLSDAFNSDGVSTVVDATTVAEAVIAAGTDIDLVGDGPVADLARSLADGTIDGTDASPLQQVASGDEEQNRSDGIVQDGSVGGNAGLFGIAAADDLFAQLGNRQDEATLTFTDLIFDSTSGIEGTADFNENLAHRIAYTAAHEGAHTLTYIHTTGTTTATTLLASGDFIRLGSNTREDPFQVVRFDLGRQNGFPVAEPNNYLFAANDPDIGLRDDNRNGTPDFAYVSGTGAHDRITLTSASATTVTVLVEAFSDSARTQAIDSETYVIDLTSDTEGEILIDSGINSDEIIIDSNINASFRVRGGTGRDGGAADDSIDFIGAVTNFAFNEIEGTGTATLLSGRNLVFSEIEFLAEGSVSGVVFDDVDVDGIRDGGEGGLAGVVVYRDENEDGVRQILSTQTAEPDVIGTGVSLRNAFPDITLTVVGNDNMEQVGFSVFAGGSALTSSTGTLGFARGTSSGTSALWADVNRLRIDFATATTFVAIDAISDDTSDIGNLEIFAADGTSLGFYQTADLGTGVSERMILTSATPIAYAVAYGDGFQLMGLDNLEYGIAAEEFETTAGDGSYTFDDVPAGSYQIRVEAPGLRVQTTQGGPGNPAVVDVGPGQDVTGVEFGLSPNPTGNRPPEAQDATFQVVESIADLTSVGTVTATDPDTTAPNNTLTYSILSGNVGGAFAIDSASGEITVADTSAIDFETSMQFQLVVQVSDGGTPSLSDEATITIDVLDVNEAPTINDQSFSVSELAAVTTSVGFVVANDEDTVAPNNTLSYRILSGNLGNTFNLDAGTGELTVANTALLDFETNAPFSLIVEVSDGATPSLTSTATVTVNISDENEPPTVNDATFTVSELASNLDLVGQVSASDPDTAAPNSTLTFAIIGGNIGGAFSIDSVSGEIRVAAASAIDFEVLGQYQLTIEVSDGGTPALSDTATVTIDVTDENEAPIIVDQSFRIAEDASSGSRVGFVVAGDPDTTAPLGDVQLSITGGNTLNAFAINGATGEITVANAAALDFETSTRFVLTITATDGGTPALSTDAQVIVEVADANDAPIIADQNLAVSENTFNGAVVGTVIAGDADQAPPANTLTYAIVGGNASNAFSINQVTGQLTVANADAVDFETTPQFQLTIQVTDGGNPALSATAVLTVDVLDVNDTVRILTETDADYSRRLFRWRREFEFDATGEIARTWRVGSSQTGAATWTFDNVPDGDYVVSASWVAWGERTANATYRVFDVTGQLVELPVNQRSLPNSIADEDGKLWRDLAQVSVVGGRVVVQLSANAPGLLIAESVRLVPIVPLPQSQPASVESPVDGAASVGASRPVGDSIFARDVVELPLVSTVASAVESTGEADAEEGASAPSAAVGNPAAATLDSFFEDYDDNLLLNGLPH